MARIFISHSSKDNFEAIALKAWLAREGWDDVFLDLDPDRGIAPGERWERALHAAANRCEAVIFVVTRHWLDSPWCLKELGLARGLNRNLFAVLVGTTAALRDLPEDVAGTWQAVDLAGGQDLQLFPTILPGGHEERHVGFSRDGLRRLKRGLEKAGLDPRYFAWPPPDDAGRSPYRGLKPLDEVDTGIFFGRDAAILEARDRLKGLAAASGPRLFVILGASGAGKSSFLRAGLVPRLKRDDHEFLPLGVIRPGRAALSGEAGLLAALVVAFPDRTRAALRDAAARGAEGLRPLLTEHARTAAAGRVGDGRDGRSPVLVIAVDQAEELFRADGGEESRRVLSILGDLAGRDEPAVMAIFAIRSDSYDALQHAKALEGMPQATMPLLPMPRAAYSDVIEGPARRFREVAGRFAIEPRLTARLLEDLEAGGSDALPLLASTLEQLFLDYHRAGVIGLADYERFGGLNGAIQAAVDRAFARADGAADIPRNPRAREALLRRGLIPWLAGIDPDTRSPRRNRARQEDIPTEAAPLIDLLVEERLLSRDVEPAPDGSPGAAPIVTLEPAHEALLRQWGLLEGWLKEDFGLLTTLEGVKRAARDWRMNAEGEGWLAHSGSRLAEARALDVRHDIAARLDAVDRAYLDGCRAREEAARAAEAQRVREREDEQARRIRDAEALAEARRRTARRTLAGLAVVSVLLVAVAVLLWKTREFLIASQAAEAIASSQNALHDGRDEEAVSKARRAFELLPSPGSRSAFLTALLAVSPYARGSSSAGRGIGTAIAWVDADHIAVGFASGDVVDRGPSRQDDDRSGDAPTVLGDQGIVALARTDDGVIAVHADGRGSLLLSGQPPKSWIDPAEPLEAASATTAAASLARDGRTLAFATAAGDIAILRRGGDGTRIPPPDGSAPFTTVALSPDARLWAAATRDGRVVAGETAEPSSARVLGVGIRATSLAWSRDGTLLATGGTDGTLTLFDATHPDREPRRRSFGKDSLAGLAWNPADDRLALPCGHLVCVVRVTDGDAGPCHPPQVTRLSGLRNAIRAIAWSPAGDRVAALDFDGAVRFWALAPDGDVRTPLACGTTARVTALVASPADGLVAAGTEGGDVVRWAPPAAAAERLGGDEAAPVGALALDSRGDLAAAREDGTLSLPTAAGHPDAVEVAPGHALSGLAWLAGEGRWAALVREGGEVRLVGGADSPAVRLVCPGRPGLIGEALASDPAGKRVYVSMAGRIEVCDPGARRWLDAITVSGDRTVAAQSLAMSPDGRWLAKSGGDFYAAVLDLVGPPAEHKIPTGESDPHAVAASPDGRRLAVLGSDGVISVWSVAPGAPPTEEESFAGLTALPDRDPEGGGTVEALTWAGEARLAIATSRGAVSLITLDPARWTRRADGIDGPSPPGRQ